jgi:serine/threonine-protein kinase
MSDPFPERFGRYTLLQRVAVGGMAEILLAIEDTAHQGKRFVTIKRIREEYAHDPDYIDFFLTEGRVSMQCSHPNLTSSFDLDTVDGVQYLAMEYIRGHTLLDLIRAAYNTKTHITPGTALRIVSEVAAALEHLHGMVGPDGKPMCVVHRDVTPQNIMIDSTGSVKLIDFGIARSEVQVHKTQAGTVKGKLSYIAPEQLKSNNTIDQRADVFSLGIVLHETLTSRGLFRGKDDADTLKRILKMPVPLVSVTREDVPFEVDIVMQQAMERDLNRRYASAKAFGDAIAELGSLAPLAATEVLRDEVLKYCGDPPVPTLGGDAFSVLKSALRRADSATDEKPAEDTSAQASEHDLDYFLKRGGANVKEAEKESSLLDAEEALRTLPTPEDN